MINRNDLNEFLETLVASLEVPESMYQKAMRRFDSITDHLRRPNSLIRKYDTRLYPQGSFNLGTAIKPFDEDGHYDVDVVCELNETKSAITQKSLKELVGHEVKEYQRINGFLKKPEDNRRCWTLLYADTEQFHLDILPAIPDKEGFSRLLIEKRASAYWTDTAIAITDQKHPRFTIITDDWYVSNPKGYAEWFKSKITKRIEKLAEYRQVRVDQIPTYNVKSTLQKTIQILKRHRDILFKDDHDNKPISVIITTLAAQFYNSEDSLLDALANIISKMSTLTERNPTGLKVQNPVNPLENFTDKWTEKPSKEQAFRFWVSRINEDLSNALEAGDVTSVAEIFAPSFGENMIKTAVNKYNIGKGSNNLIVLNERAMPSRFNVPHRQKPPWPVSMMHKVKLQGYYGPSRACYEFASNSNPLPKHNQLRFIATTDVGKPFDVYWQIVNTGFEAQSKNQLRGEIVHSKTFGAGGLSHEERTEYTGCHWVECFIVKDGVCIARSGEYVVNVQ